MCCIEPRVNCGFVAYPRMAVAGGELAYGLDLYPFCGKPLGDCLPDRGEPALLPL